RSRRPRRTRGSAARRGTRDRRCSPAARGAPRLPAPLRLGRGVEALDRHALRVRGVGRAPLERSRSGAPHPQGLARLARVGTQSSRSARRCRCAYVQRATCNVPPVFGRPRLCLELQASRGLDGFLPTARRPRARPRRVASVPAGGLSVVDRTSSEFRSALELYERATLLELGALADQARWRLHPETAVPTSSTATSTTPTSASPTASSARSTAAPS